MIGSGAGSARVRARLAVAALALAGGAGERVAGAGPPAEAPHAAPANAGTTIGVLYFDYAGKNAELAPLSKGLAQMLISDLAAVDTVRVVERERLQAVLDEQKLGESWKKAGKIDGRTAARIGKLLGARYLVLGTYFDAMGAFRADARLVDVETGQIVKSIGANGKAEDFMGLEQMLANGLCKAAAQLPPPRDSLNDASEHVEHKDSEHRGGEHGVARPPAHRIPKPPRGLKASTAVTYGKALAAADAGDRKQAQSLFKSVLADQPDFELAQRDLDKLIQ
jgi:TolB-like protein